MALRHATANGNWSNPATWDGGTSLPGLGDTVYANNKAVTLDQDVDINSTQATVAAGLFFTGCRYRIKTPGTTNWTGIGAQSAAAGCTFTATSAGSGTGDAHEVGTLANASLASPAITAGGSFTTSGERTIKADVAGGSGNAGVYCLVAASTTTLSGTIFWGLAANSNAVLVNANQSLHHTGDVGAAPNMGNGNNSTAGGIKSAANSVHVSIQGNVYGAPGSGSASYGVFITHGSCTLVIAGDCKAVTASSNSSTNAVYVAGTGNTVTITGDCHGAYGDGVSITGTGNTVTVTGNLRGSTTASYGTGANISGTGTSVTVDGNIQGGTCASAHGATFGYGTFVVNGDVTAGEAGVNSSAHGLNAGGNPGAVTINGTVAASSTANGVYTSHRDSVVRGNGDLHDHANGMSALFAARVIVGVEAGFKQRKALDGVSTFTWWAADFDHAAPSDVRHGTVYASGIRVGTCHVPAPESVAAGTPVDDTVGSAVLTGAQIPSAADMAASVRAELAAELARLDAAVSSRLAADGYTPPANADIAAVKGVTDQLNPVRLANVSTVETTGNQLAAAMSPAG